MQPILACMIIGTLFGAGLAVAKELVAENKLPHPIARFDEQFSAADKNGDGALSREEAGSARMNRIVEHFDQLDVNKDGKVTRDEIRALLRARVLS